MKNVKIAFDKLNNVINAAKSGDKISVNTLIGVSYLLEKALEQDKLKTEIEESNLPFDVRQEVRDMLNNWGCPKRIVGYEYIPAMVELMIREGINKTHGYATKTLYPTVAKEFNSRPQRVERAARHCIGHMLMNDNFIEDLKVYQNKGVCVTELLSYIYYELKKKIKEG